MKIAQYLRETNRAEYLLYMWQVEDLLRSFSCDIEQLKDQYLDKFNYDGKTQQQVECWYSELCDMMREEDILHEGHLQICKNTLSLMEELHIKLLSSSRFPYYRTMYHKILPHLVMLRSKNKKKNSSELEMMLEVLYGVMLLKLQRKTISEETTLAIKDLSILLGQLSDYLKQDQEHPLEFE